MSVTLGVSAAHADATVQICSDSYTKGQEERLAGRLVGARAQFQICADPTCPGAIVQDCQRWVTEVEADLPSAVIRVTDTAGRAPTGLSVFLDGHSLPLDALGKPLLMSPGPHVLRFEAPGFQLLELDAALRPEDRLLPIDALLRSTPAAAPPLGPRSSVDETAQPAPAESSSRVPVAAVSFGAIGVIALGGSVFFGLSAKSRYDELKSECAPKCAQSKIDSVKSKALISDIALATSVVAFGAAAYFYFTAEPQSSPTAALGIEPIQQGASARLRLSF